MRRYLLIIITIVFCHSTLWAGSRRLSPKDAFADSVMNLVFRYAQTVDTTGQTAQSSYAYTKFQIRTNKRNATLMLVPTMYVVAHGGCRRFISEFYSRVKLDNQGKPVIERLLNTSTIPHRRNTMDQALRYMTPNVYGETLFQESILSPFHRSNRRYYRYAVTPLPFGMAQIYVYPRVKNTQVVTTRAIVSSKTGKITMVDFEGEYDMTHFYITVKMGKEGFQSLGPEKCDMRANFRFMGNRISGMYTTVYNLPHALNDTIRNVADTALMSKVRPIKLNQDEEAIYQDYFARKMAADSLKGGSRGKNFAKDFLWDVVGDNMLNRISSGFGKQKQGYFRMSPLFNPLYMGYSGRKGLVYKFDVRSSYAFTKDLQLGLRFRGGYSMRQHRFYFKVPFTFDYNAKHEGRLSIEVGNGNRITSNIVARSMLGIPSSRDTLGTNVPLLPPGSDLTGLRPDALQNAIKNLDDVYDFKDNYLKIQNRWRFDEHFAFEAGLVSHNRIAVRPAIYKAFDYPSKYTSVAPTLALEWSPIGAKGPVLKLDYERGLKNLFKSNINYERWEFDAQTILYASRRRSFSLRFGAGFYTRKGAHWNFVDYTNFHDDNIPGGWNDSWSGEFELLSSQWYNASDYYLRSNFTYEAPMIAMAWFPIIGRFIEKERLYVSGLSVKRLSPYTEWGYAITTRLMTLGTFAAFKEGTFDGVGFRFGFELFGNW